MAGLCDRRLATVQNQRPKTPDAKQHAAARIKTDFPGGADVPGRKGLPPQVSVKTRKHDKPIRPAPTLEEFRAIVADSTMAGSMDMERVFCKPKLLRALASLDPQEFARLAAGLESLLATERQERTDDGPVRQRAFGGGGATSKLPVARAKLICRNVPSPRRKRLRQLASRQAHFSSLTLRQRTAI